MSELVAPPSAVSVRRPRARRAVDVARSYLALTKPRVIELLLVTTVPAMVMAAEGIPDLGLVAAVLVGGAFAAGGANTVNCWIERDRDQLMARTRHRPLPAGDLEPARALVFGLALEVLAFALLWASANLLAAVLALAAALFYVFVYTIWLKPRTAQNIVIGGAAGAVPVLVGWAAVTGSVSASAWLLFGVIFLWTPAHFWALALRYEHDYAAAGVPMLPVTRGTEAAVRQILAYTVVVTVVSLALPLVGPAGLVYVAAVGALGAVFTLKAVQLRREPTPERALRFFVFSNVYLALLFAAVAVDALVRNA